MKILNNLLLVEPEAIEEEKTKTGIIIANYEPQSKLVREVYPNKGKVIALDERLTDFKVGDIVHFQRWGATEYEIEGRKVLFINPRDILAKEE